MATQAKIIVDRLARHVFSDVAILGSSDVARRASSDVEKTPAPLGKLDRRLSPRRFCNLTAKYTSLRQPEIVITIKIQDISLGGIGFVADQCWA